MSFIWNVYKNRAYLFQGTRLKHVLIPRVLPLVRSASSARMDLLVAVQVYDDEVFPGI